LVHAWVDSEAALGGCPSLLSGLRVLDRTPTDIQMRGTKMKIYRALIPAALMLGALALPTPSSAAVAIGISVGIAPPLLPIYEQPLIPGPGYVWTPGYWAYGSYGYYWVPGTWLLPPTIGFLWTPPWWGWSDGGYLWHGGYWGRMSGSTAASTTATVIQAWASRAAIGITTSSSITARSITSATPTSATSTAGP